MVLTKQELHILTSSKKGRVSLHTWLYSCFQMSCIHKYISENLHVLCAAALLQELVGPAQSEAGVKLEFLERAKGDDSSSRIQSLLDLVKAQNGANIGTLPKVRYASLLTSSILVMSDIIPYLQPSMPTSFACIMRNVCVVVRLFMHALSESLSYRTSLKAT